MQFEEAYSEDRLVTCNCGFDGHMELQIVSYGLTEMSEWNCPGCENLNDYTNDLTGDYEDRAYDRRKEDW